MERIIERTDDGSATLFVPELNEHYHSTKGARTESQHIFIDMGLKASSAASPRILEIGFGTGLNAWLTLKEAERSGRNIHYTGLELYPLDWQTVEQLSYISGDEQLTIHRKQSVTDEPSTSNGEQQPAIELFKQLHTSPWGKDVQLTSHFTLRKIETDVNQWITEKRFDTIYFDAFAPEKQPEMWSQELFNRLYVLLDKGGILTTYCAKGIVRRMLQSAGFTVERLPGPPGGKREILRARK
ncbi:tRNA (5-methylaminomethyl-2-thiouridine)(34)-methyltransferase MnmD [Bacteroides sp. AN502(2024)]|uniref:tRNA (5-methylaminomethyl-2-thiouridine)(34)-methyltransferase MnmD n=1 Tax=Bacteroides sp. AN502(2024) TaxID=3160599 RepID=UPI00351146B2